MDYEALLKKYMTFVADEEGTTFVSHIGTSWVSTVEFTEEEHKELMRLDVESLA